MAKNNKIIFKIDDVEYAIIKPTTKKNEDASMEYNRVFSKALQSGALLRETLDKYMRKQNLWDDDKELQYAEIFARIGEKEESLKSGGIKLSEAKNIALSMKTDRAELQNLIAEKNVLDQNTAQGQAENARFNYLLVVCLVYNDNGLCVFDSVDDFDAVAEEAEEGQENVALLSAQKFAAYYYGVDDDFERNLTENKFLKQYGFVNDDLDLVNEEGNLVDFEGRLIDSDGRFIDEKGNFIDYKGNPVDEVGQPLTETKPFLDDSGNELSEEGDAIEKKESPQPKKKRGRPKKKSVSTDE